MGKAHLRESELLTLLTEAENVVNSRPLANVSDDLTDQLPITPTMLLHGREFSKFSAAEGPTKESAPSMYQRWHQTVAIAKQFRQRFQKDYLAELLKVTKWYKETEDVALGQIVLISGERFKSRIEWPLGKIIQLQYGRDGHVSSVLLRTASGELRRPVQCLIPLEVSASQADIDRESASQAQKGSAAKVGKHAPSSDSQSLPPS